MGGKQDASYHDHGFGNLTAETRHAASLPKEQTHPLGATGRSPLQIIRIMKFYGFMPLHFSGYFRSCQGFIGY
jgi:hypothetical protein